MEHRFDENHYKRKNIVLAIVLTLLVIALEIFMTNYQYILEGKWTQKFLNNTIVIPVISIFFLIKYVFRKITLPEKLEKLIITLGSCTFGIYLFDNVLRKETLFIYEKLNVFLPTIIACFLWIITVYIIGTILIWCLKKLPIIRKLI